MAKNKPKQQQPTPIAEKRDSFIPQAEPPPPPEVVEANAPPSNDGPVRLQIEQDGRSLKVTLTVPPLEPCVANRPNILPNIGGSPERLASIIADTIAEAAASAREDGIFQHYRREQEENEAKTRFARR